MLTSLRLILVFMHVPPPHRNCTIRTDTAHGEEHGSLGTSFKRTRPFYYEIYVFRCNPLL